MMLMSRENGTELNSIEDHIRQSVADILTTPIGTRLMREEYGSLWHELIDAPFNEFTRMQLYAATAIALIKYEDRIFLDSMSIFFQKDGEYILDITYTQVNDNKKNSLSIPLNFGAIV